MPEVTKDANPDFFHKLTEDTLRKNEELKEYYVKIESLYNGNSICFSEQEAEVTECEATEAIDNDQGSESDKCSNNDQEYNIFFSKISNTLVKLLNQFDNFSLLQHDPSKQCVYFKYWYYDKILKNIFSQEKLECFYKEIEDEDNEDRGPIVEEDRKEPREEFFDHAEEEEEEELVDGSSLNSEEDDTEESEDTQEGKSQHRYKSEDNDSDEILLSLSKLNSCNIYKLNLNQIRDIKLLYGYLEDDKSKNISSIGDEISKSTYCSSFNKTIELYNEKSKCKSDYPGKKFCRELEEFWNNYSHTKIPILSCNTQKSVSDLPPASVGNKELQEARQTSLSTERAASSDSTTNTMIIITELIYILYLFKCSISIRPSSFQIFIDFQEPVDITSTTQHMSNDIDEKHSLNTPKHVTAYGNPNTQMQSSRDIRGSYSPDSEASSSCHNDSAGKHCENSLQRLLTMRTEASTNLNTGGQENTEKHVEKEGGLQEETSSTNTIVSSASSVLGISALAFMLYKFTPLGSLINNRRGGMDTWDINEEGYDENLLFSSALGNTNSKNNNYSIGYYPLGNT
ncbi:PIR protein [Plasmodium ovale]|uniref:PIR protein n=1 Tax=Plasmodium ovale TaxID=36330 RepID=A0A1D3JCP8_PLAOA|nr:PIR protein [Plasmodium ovale]